MLAALFEATGSLVVEDTLAAFVSVRVLMVLTVTAIVTVNVPPGLSAATVQVTPRAAVPHVGGVPLTVVAEIVVTATLGGRVSETVTPALVSGPLLITLMM